MKKEGIIGHPESPFKKGGSFPSGPQKCDGGSSVPDHHTIHTSEPKNIKPKSDDEPNSGIVKNWNNLAEKN